MGVVEECAKKGVAFPKTMDEMAVAAEKLNDPTNGIYGFTGSLAGSGFSTNCSMAYAGPSP